MGCFLSVWLAFSGKKGSLTSGAGTSWRGGNWNFPGLANTGFHRVSKIRLKQKRGAGRAKLRRGLRNEMKDKVVLITGAKGGLGSFVTQRFLGTGATVIGTSRSITKEDFPEPNFVPLPVDFTKSVAVREAVESVVSRFGKLDVLVHVPGGFAGGKTVAETDD